MPYAVEQMRPEDIPEVMSIERESFSATWPASAYRRELGENRLARYIVVRELPDEQAQYATGEHVPEETAQPPAAGGLWQFVSTVRGWVTGPRPATEVPLPRSGQIVGYLGVWLMVDEAHITTIAVRASHRRRGFGALLLLAAVDLSTTLGGNVLTLEVRVSNVAAQNLYEQFGFLKVGLRPRYYSDNNEDAIIMTSEPIPSTSFQARLRQIRQRMQATLGDVIWKLYSTPSP